MPKRARELSARTVASLRGDGRYAVGVVPGLYLRIEGASRSWVLRRVREGKRREAGLGSYPTVSLAAAREVAWALRRTPPPEPRQGFALERASAAVGGERSSDQPASRLLAPAANAGDDARAPSKGALGPISRLRRRDGNPRSTGSNGCRLWRSMHFP